MFRRENRKCFGETEKLFRSKPSSRKRFRNASRIFWRVPEMFWDLPEFFRRERARKTHVPRMGDKIPRFMGCFLGRPLLGAAPFDGRFVGGAPPWWGHPHKCGTCLREVGPPMREVAGQGVGAPPWGNLPPLVG